MGSIKAQLDDLQIPYPQKKEFELEVRGDLHSAPQNREVEFASEDLEELYQIHNTQLLKILNFYSIKKHAELAFTMFPLTLLLTYLGKERFMIEFIREGGLPMLIIIALGLPLIFREGLNLFRLLVIKDHSEKNRHLDTSSVMLGCLALLCLGLGGTGTGLYLTASAVIKAGVTPDMMLLGFQGMKESLGNIILSTTAASLILIMHFTTRKMLMRWQAPILD